jgi:phosphate transport system protein
LPRRLWRLLLNGGEGRFSEPVDHRRARRKMTRLSFAEELNTVERSLISGGELVGRQLVGVMDALVRSDHELAERLVAQDDVIDDVYLATEMRLLNLIALQAPVAGDLRLVSAILHSNLHLERMGDLCVNIAKFVLNRHRYPIDSPMIRTLRQMGSSAEEMLQLALKSFERRDVGLAEQLPDLDDTLDRLNRTMLDHLVDFTRVERNERATLEWSIKLLLVARYLERIGDHAVDVGEQVSFLVTGVFREFTDASHPKETDPRPVPFRPRPTSRAQGTNL